MDFPKSARVLARRDYLRFFQESESRRLGVCTLYRIAGTTGVARLGITVKARVNSVYRNKLKRQIREAFRSSRASLGVFDYNVVIPGGVRVDHRTVHRVRSQLDANWRRDDHF